MLFFFGKISPNLRILVCKIFGTKLRLCKIFDKFQVLKYMSGSETRTRTMLATCTHPWWTMQRTSSGLSSSSLSPSLSALLACTMPGKSAQIQKNLRKILTLSCTSGHLAPLSYLLQSLWVLYYLTPAMPSGAIFIFVKSDECGCEM